MRIITRKQTEEKHYIIFAREQDEINKLCYSTFIV